jgi:TPR repeat protein
VALKFCLDDRARRQLLEHETAVLDAVLSQGKHPGIVQLRHTYLSADPPCLEYEYVEGGDLGVLVQEWHRTGQATPKRVNQLMLGLSGIVAFAHKLPRPIVHRDLKPANVLVQPRGGEVALRVTDFGIGSITAEQARRETQRTTTAATGGGGSYTPLYASPQQKRGDKADPRDDVYSLGVLWYQLLTGDLNAAAPTGNAWQERLRRQGLSAAALALLVCCLEERAEDRVASAAEVEEGLRRDQEGHAEADCPRPERPVGPALPPDRKQSVEPPRQTVRQPPVAQIVRPTMATLAEPDQASGENGRRTEGRSPGQPWLTRRLMLLACLGVAVVVGGWLARGWLFPTKEELYRRGMDLYLGQGVSIDDERAVQCFRRAAEKGHDLACARLAWSCYHAIGIDRDEDEAQRWARRGLTGVQAAAADGDADAQTNLGNMYLKGLGVDKDEKAAVNWYRKAAEKGNAQAMNNLGGSYANGHGVQKDEKAAVSWYRQAADKGDADAMTNLGGMYADGRGVEKDEKKAVNWYRQAADKGHASAMGNLGEMYDDGRGVEKDETKAANWYRKAADKGHAYAMHRLGVMYEYGRGVGRDDKEAVKWFRKAAAKEVAESMTGLGNMYREGHGLKRDDEEAVKWFRKAADKGESTAMYNLGWMYVQGLGVRKDETEAVKWFRKAADKGNPTALGALGIMYEQGRGVEKDRAEALKWYRKAAALGDENAKKAVSRLESIMGLPQGVIFK